MLTAEEAKNIVLAREDKAFEKWMDDAAAKINERCNAGGINIYMRYESDIYSRCKKSLEDLGYKVEYISSINFEPAEVKISWG